MSLETIARATDNFIVRLPALATGSSPNLPEVRCFYTTQWDTISVRH